MVENNLKYDDLTADEKTILSKIREQVNSYHKIKKEIDNNKLLDEEQCKLEIFNQQKAKVKKDFNKYLN